MTPTRTRDARLQRKPERGERVRRHELHVHWPELSRGSWGKAIDNGSLPVHRIPGIRATFVLVDDVIAFLDGSLADRHTA